MKKPGSGRARKPARLPGPRRIAVRQYAQQMTRWLMQRELWALAVTALGAVTAIALISGDQGQWTSAWSLLLRQIFGVGAYPLALLILASGVILLFWESLGPRLRPRWPAVIGAELLFFLSLGLLHLSAPADVAWWLAATGRRGGYVGWTFRRLLVPNLGVPISVLLLGLGMVASLFLAAGIPYRVAIWRVRWVWARVGVPLRVRLLQRRKERLARLVAAVSDASGPPQPERHSAQQTAMGRSARAAPATRSGQTRPLAPTPVPAAKRRQRKGVVALPSLDLLLPDQSDTGDDADARQRAQVIQDTLDAFGVPAKVVEWRRGPVVTQFGIVPGYVERSDREGATRRFKIRVSKILSLSNDLALALAASPIRIEAPVPGRAMVGIEVPNAQKAVVGLRGVLESSAFQSKRAQLRVGLGRDVSGAPVVADLARMPHLLLAGATGTGKSACLNALLASLLFFNPPDRLKLLLVDPKRVELTRFNRIPHLIAPVVVDIEKVVVALRWVIREMEHRYEAFAKDGARNLETYNGLLEAKGLEPLPTIVVMIDELADVMLAAPDEVERTLCRIAQMARATGIHLVVATQRPSVDVVTGLIKANFPARVSFAVTSQVDSRVILDVPGAEKLLGRGDMLYMAPDAPELQRIQGCWVSDEELDSMIAFWRQAAREVALPEDDEEEAPWEGMALDESDANDDLLSRAIALVREHAQASASFLQRQMRIGYPRAARLIDELERQGIIGPAESGGRSRSVLTASPELAESDSASDEPVEEPAQEPEP